MAVQPRLGLLPQRLPGSCPGCPDHLGAPWENLAEEATEDQEEPSSLRGTRRPGEGGLEPASRIS